MSALYLSGLNMTLNGICHLCFSYFFGKQGCFFVGTIALLSGLFFVGFGALLFMNHFLKGGKG
jgi:hypothetical protein